MFIRGRVKPSKGASLFGMIVGIGFLIFGFTTILPHAPGIFGLIWIAAAIGISVVNGINFFSSRGVSQWEVDVEPGVGGNASKEDFESRLRKLERLRQDLLITEEEYQQKRAEILHDKW